MNMAGAGGKTGADAIMAGADIVLAPSDTRAEIEALTGAVRSGRFPLGLLRDRVRRVLVCKHRFLLSSTGREAASADNSVALQRAL